ncbi:Uncharacterised protein [uncultured archaeon]|nr:Uncharacterised protein [uncultured archaeon]
MDYLLGYGGIGLAMGLGYFISYMDSQQRKDSNRTTADHIKIALLCGAVAFVILFINSGDAIEFISGKAVAEGAEKVVEETAKASKSVVSETVKSVVPKTKKVVDKFAMGLASF